MPILSKPSLRTTMRALREGLSADYARAAAESVAVRLDDVIESQAVVAGYHAIRGEIDVMPACLRVSARAGLCLPVIMEGQKALQFRQWRPGETLETGAYGIQAPPASAPALTPTILLAPLLAFDLTGHRLGYGGGHYDATIARLRQSAKPLQIIGVAYACQRVDALPAEAHDERLDAVVTEEEMVRFT